MSAKQVFDKFDKNKDGKLSLEEFTEVALAFNKKFPEEDIAQMFKEIDVDGDGQLEADEFTSCVEKMLKEVFGFCDDDRDGKMTVSEFYEAMRALGIDCTEASVAEMVRVADVNGDGYLNFEEFMAMVIRIIL